MCPRWLHGTCPLGTQCTLQHQRKPELMPVCMHFLKARLGGGVSVGRWIHGCREEKQQGRRKRLCCMPPSTPTTPHDEEHPGAAGRPLPPLLQGRCTAAGCPYLHVNLPPAAPACKRFLRGYCPAGAACPHKHFTLRMVREEKRLDAAAAGGGGAAQAGRGAQGGGTKRRKGGAAGRYFETAPPGSPAAAAADGQDAEQQQQETSGEEESSGAEESDGEGGWQRGAKRRRASDALKPSFLLGDYVPL